MGVAILGTGLADHLVNGHGTASFIHDRAAAYGLSRRRMH
jgi:hypothetical protein